MIEYLFHNIFFRCYKNVQGVSRYESRPGINWPPGSLKTWLQFKNEPTEITKKILRKESAKKTREFASMQAFFVHLISTRCVHYPTLFARTIY